MLEGLLACRGARGPSVTPSFVQGASHGGQDTGAVLPALVQQAVHFTLLKSTRRALLCHAGSSPPAFRASPQAGEPVALGTY